MYLLWRFGLFFGFAGIACSTASAAGASRSRSSGVRERSHRRERQPILLGHGHRELLPLVPFLTVRRYPAWRRPKPGFLPGREVCRTPIAPAFSRGGCGILRGKDSAVRAVPGRPAPKRRGKQPRSAVMPIASPEVYAEMLDRAKAGGFAYPAINVTSSQTLNAALQRLRRGGERRHRPGLHRRRRVPVRPDRQGHGHRRRWRSPRSRTRWPRSTRSTSRCTPTTARRTSSTGSSARCSRSPRSGSPAARSRCSSRTCGTARPCRWSENLQIAEELLAEAAAAKVILEIEVGVVGGEEDGVVGAIDEKLYTTVEDGLATAEALGLGEKGRYMAALTFGNVHGVYKPGNVKLRPEILKEIQDAVGAKYGKEKPFDLVFHGGSGSLLSEIRDGARLRRGEDEHRHRHPVRVHPPGRRPHVHATTTACSRSTARSATRRPTTRAPGARRPRTGMAKRVVEACEDLRSTGTTLGK